MKIETIVGNKIAQKAFGNCIFQAGV